MKIQKKLLSAFLGIVLIFAVVGTIMTLNTLQVAYLQKEANTQAQIGSYATTYQMGIDMKKYAYLEGSTGNIEASKADDAMANAIIEPAEAWLLENIPKDSELYAEFYSCYEINHNTIAGISSEIAYIFDNELTDRYVEVDTVYTPQLETAYDQITYNLMQFQASVMDNIEQTNKEVVSLANEMSKLGWEVADESVKISSCAKEVITEAENVGKTSNTVVAEATAMAEVVEQMKNEVVEAIERRKEILRKYVSDSAEDIGEK